MLSDKDRIFTNLYGLQDPGLEAAKRRGQWDNTKAILELGPDGRVIRADSASVNPGNLSRYNYAAGIAARNAIYQCQPYKLPADRYPQWRQINPMRFDPRQNP